MDKAIALVAEMRNVDGSWHSVPSSNSEIRNRVAQYRRVWHLWAAWRILRAQQEKPASGKFEEELADLIGIALTVQDWALAWRPRRGDTGASLLNADNAHLIPNTVTPRKAQWGDEPFTWLAEALKRYTPRPR